MDPHFQSALVVDDSRTVRHFLKRTLESAGFRTRQAENGAEALNAVRTECPYFIIVDWCMSPVNGIEFCQLLRRERLPHYVYVIVVTGLAKADGIVTAIDAGADDFITKPVNRVELLARLRAGARVLELEKRLSELARSDPLTGLLNRRAFYQLLEKEWDRAARYQLPLSCAMLDVDRFKRINDTHGHSAGDSVLKSLARLLFSISRGSDYVCRFGGEEFCFLLPETDEAGAAVWAERCRLGIAATEFACGEHAFSITVSLGVAGRRDTTGTADQMLDCADQALLVAKRGGRNRVEVFGELSSLDLVLA